MKHLLLCVGISMFAAGCTSMGGHATADTPADTASTTATAYVSMAGSSDLFEIESSRLALQRAPSASVKQFAQMMIEHHMMTTQQVTQAAQSAGMAPSTPTLLPPQSAMLAKLQPLNGGDFERVYLEQQRAAHRMALELHQRYASGGDTPQLRKVAATAVPIVQSHIDRLGQLPSG